MAEPLAFAISGIIKRQAVVAIVHLVAKHGRPFTSGDPFVMQKAEAALYNDATALIDQLVEYESGMIDQLQSQVVELTNLLPKPQFIAKDKRGTT